MLTPSGATTSRASCNVNVKPPAMVKPAMLPNGAKSSIAAVVARSASVVAPAGISTVVELALATPGLDA